MSTTLKVQKKHDTGMCITIATLQMQNKHEIEGAKHA
jgi:hypothetical protein